MNPAAWGRVKEILGDALYLGSAERERFLEAACGGDSALRREVRGLLEVHARTRSFLEPPLVSRSLHAILVQWPPSAAGDGADWSGRLVAGRYRLRERIGAGSAGVVYRGEDLLTGEAVAVKVLDLSLGRDLPRREIAALRLLRLPGVVGMLEDGVEEDRTFIAMDLVEGSPYPGRPRPATFDAIAETTIALLETLDRVHASGFLHRDLKPQNVLVRRDGRPVLLDLGLALHPSGPATAPAERGAIVGTPSYLAPEQLRGETLTPAADLFALGVMVYQALAGRLPHPASTFSELLESRAQSPPPLADLAPQCPARVVEWVHRLLRQDPRDRPASAAEALHLLRGDRLTTAGTRRLPWLGSRASVESIVDAVLAGRSRDLFGIPGSGRTRCLEEAAQELRARGREVRWFRRENGIADWLDPAERSVLGSLDDAVRVAGERLRADLRGGVALFVDDAEELENRTAALLEEARAAGAIVRACASPRPDAIALAPLGPEDLGRLFAGPDRVFHLRKDAAETLFDRTRGDPRAVTEEVGAWVRAGIGRFDGDRIEISREEIDRLRTRIVRVAGRAPDAARVATLADDVRELAALAGIAGRQCRAEILGPLLRRPAWKVEAQLEELARLRLLRPAGAGRFEPAESIDLPGLMPAERRRAIHLRLALALPEGDEERLLHLVAARAIDLFPAEARRRAEELRKEGHFRRAIAFLEEALLVLKEEPDHPERCGILEDLLLLSFLPWSVRAMERVLYEVEMAGAALPNADPMQVLARGALSLGRGTWERSLHTLDAPEPFADERFELTRQTLRVLAARRGGVELERRIVEEASGWAAGSSHPEARRSMTVWLAWLRYNERRFDEAAELHARAADLAPSPPIRAVSLGSRASALNDGFRPREALRALDDALAIVRPFRDPSAESRLEMLRRDVLARLGLAGEPDEELVDLIERCSLEQATNAAVIEGGVAWRLGRTDLARSLALRAHRGFNSIGRRGVAVLPRALAATCGATLTREEALESVAVAEKEAPPGVAVQAIGFLALALPELTPTLGETARRIVDRLPPEHHRFRREILSIDEALLCLQGGDPIDGTADQLGRLRR